MVGRITIIPQRNGVVSIKFKLTETILIIGGSMKVGYVRVSTVDQNESRQLVRMEEAKEEKQYIEKVSGKDIEG